MQYIVIVFACNNLPLRASNKQSPWEHGRAPDIPAGVYNIALPQGTLRFLSTSGVIDAGNPSIIRRHGLSTHHA